MSNSLEQSRNLSSKMGLILLMVSLALLFGALSLGFFAAPSQGRYEVPWLFFLNSGLLVISSATLHRAWHLRSRGEKGEAWIIATIVSGVFFLAGQMIGYRMLIEEGYMLSGSSQKMQFLFVLTGLHAAHLVAGLAWLGWMAARWKSASPTLLEAGTAFWHFLGVLWVYLLLVMILGM